MPEITNDHVQALAALSGLQLEEAVRTGALLDLVQTVMQPVLEAELRETLPALVFRPEVGK